MPTTEHSKEEIFAIPAANGRFYLYAPLRRSLAMVNQSMVNVIANYLKSGMDGLRPSEKKTVKNLMRQGFLGEPAPTPPIFPTTYPFCPHEVTLFLTSRCNLACRYCYADAGKKKRDMPIAVAKAAIDFVAENAGRMGSPNFAVGFHGGGEPTLAWDLLVACVAHAQKRAEAGGLAVELFIATNGALSPEKREYLATHFTTLNVSLDGPKDIQDFHRPFANGKGSYDMVAETLLFLERHGVDYGIRSTVTQSTVERLTEIVETIHQRFSPRYLHLEPVWQCGRCLTSGETTPEDVLFIDHFLKASQTADRLGVNMFYSGARLDVLTSKFCAAPGDGFSVLPEGVVTSCYEVVDLNDPRAGMFHYGHFDQTTQNFVFDTGKLKALQKLSVEHNALCRDCFCRWHCAGDCPAKMRHSNPSAEGSRHYRCRLNRALTLKKLEKLVGSIQTERHPVSHVDLQAR